MPDGYQHEQRDAHVDLVAVDEGPRRSGVLDSSSGRMTRARGRATQTQPVQAQHRHCGHGGPEHARPALLQQPGHGTGNRVSVRRLVRGLLGELIEKPGDDSAGGAGEESAHGDAGQDQALAVCQASAGHKTSM